MHKQRGARRCERRKPLKKACKATSSNDLQGAQASPAPRSPWRDPPPFDPVRETIRALQNDADRLDAISEDDRRWFEAHPGRSFHIRPSAPHERDFGFGRGWIVVCQVAPGLRLRVSVPVDTLGDPAPHDTEDFGAELFDIQTRHFTRANTNPGPFAMVELLRPKMRDALSQVPARCQVHAIRSYAADKEARTA